MRNIARKREKSLGESQEAGTFCGAHLRLGWRVEVSVVAGLELFGWDISDRGVQPSRVVPVEPRHGHPLDRKNRYPAPGDSFRSATPERSVTLAHLPGAMTIVGVVLPALRFLMQVLG